MKNKNTLPRIMGFLSVSSLFYCIFAYIYLQSVMTIGAVLTDSMRNIGNSVLPALLAVGIYHIILLVRALKVAAGKFWDSVFIVLVALSGITLFSDVTFLSDIGKEYQIWDVTNEWIMLYGFTAVHMVVVVWGLLRSKTDGHNASSAKDDRFYLSLYHIGFLSGLLGISGVIAANSGLVVPPRFVTSFAILLAGLALFPLALFVFYWISKLRHIPVYEWVDEKQFNDTALGALISIVVSVPIYILICVFDLSHITLSASSLVLGLFFIQLSVLSLTLILRNR